MKTKTKISPKTCLLFKYQFFILEELFKKYIN
jgi:hypothetical protein